MLMQSYQHPSRVGPEAIYWKPIPNRWNTWIIEDTYHGSIGWIMRNRLASRNITKKRILNSSWCPQIFTILIHWSGPSRHGNITLLRVCQEQTPVLQMHMWCQLISQATMNLNILIPCRKNPTMSAHTAIEGQFDFNKTPLAPPVINVIVHENPQQRKLGGYMECRGGTLDHLWSTNNATHVTHPTTGGKDMQMWCNFWHNTLSCQDYPQQSKPPSLPRNSYTY